MANTYLSLTLGAAWNTDLQTAINNKYGAGNITWHYVSSTTIIFSCSILSTKVIKLQRATTSSSIILSYGDAWTTGTTVTNEVIINKGGGTLLTALHIIFGDAFLCFFNAHSGTYPGSGFIGKLTSGEAIAFGTGISASYDGVGFNITTGAAIIPITFDKDFTTGTGLLYKQDMMFKTTAGILLQNSDGTPAKLTGVENVSYIGSQFAATVTASYVIGLTTHNMNGNAHAVFRTAPFFSLV